MYDEQKGEQQSRKKVVFQQRSDCCILLCCSKPFLEVNRGQHIVLASVNASFWLSDQVQIKRLHLSPNRQSQRVTGKHCQLASNIFRSPNENKYIGLTLVTMARREKCILTNAGVALYLLVGGSHVFIILLSATGIYLSGLFVYFLVLNTDLTLTENKKTKVHYTSQQRLTEQPECGAVPGTVSVILQPTVIRAIVWVGSLEGITKTRREC